MQDTTSTDKSHFVHNKQKEEDYVTGMHHVEREEGDLGKVIKPTPKEDIIEKAGHSDSEDTSSEDESKSSTTSTPSTPSSTKPPMTLQKKLIMAFKVALVVAMIVVMVHSRGEVFQKSAPPSLFFPQHSLVTDFYTGDLTALSERLLSADLSFVMYYAPWDYESQRIRLEMEKAARYHHEQIFFAAINCWHSTGSCRGRYKLRSFPALVLHVRSLSGQETKALAYGGLAEAEHMIKFLSRAMAPLIHISSTADLTKLQIDYSAIVVGYYDMKNSRYAKGFYSYYMAALRSLQYDRTHSTAWGIITNARVAAAHSMHTTRTVHQYLWNATLVYSNSSVADSTAISNWVLNNFYETSSWLDLPGTKSLQLHTLLSEGPVLFLFAPNNPFWFSNDPYSLLRELSLDYLNCDELAHVKQLSKFLASSRPGRRTLQRLTEKQCNSFMEEQLHTQHMAEERHLDAEEEMCCQSVHVWEGTVPRGQDRICDVCVHPADKLLQEDSIPCSSPNYEEGEISLMQHVRNIVSVFSDSCRDLVLQYSPWEHYSICCQSNSSSTLTTKPSFNKEDTKPPPVVQQSPPAYPGPQEDDHIVKMTELVAEDKCKRIYQASRGKLKSAFLKDVSSGQDITGLGCKTNHSLTFIAIDSIHHSDVALRLGVNLSEGGGPGNTAAVIVDVQQQVHFIMNTALSRKTLVDFILRYTRGQLDRLLWFFTTPEIVPAVPLWDIPCCQLLTICDPSQTLPLPASMLVGMLFRGTLTSLFCLPLSSTQLFEKRRVGFSTAVSPSPLPTLSPSLLPIYHLYSVFTWQCLRVMRIVSTP
ncbi:thioredoxin domain-containing protein 11-like isoform X2 [Oratosquilla oratoria]|uniref:thioredoxin domain-containing protein 11-like isoform X2 n=1 Tax=Oratosquilla oratoria TaxID=337810 RepID=UPI003F763978